MHKLFIHFTYDANNTQLQLAVGALLNLGLMAAQLGFFAYAIGLGLKLAGL